MILTGALVAKLVGITSITNLAQDIITGTFTYKFNKRREETKEKKRLIKKWGRQV